GGQAGYRQAGVGQAVRGRLGDDDRADRAEQRQQPQDRGAVDDQQDDRHDDQRGKQQDGLLVARAAVRGDRGGPGHRAGQPGGRLARGPGDRVADGAHRVAVGAARACLPGDVHGERRGLAVGRRLRRGRGGQAGHVAGQARDGAAGGGDRRLVGGRQAAVVAGEDDDGGVGFRLPGGVRGGLLEQHDLGRGGRGGQVGGGTVVGRLRQAAGQPV